MAFRDFINKVLGLGPLPPVRSDFTPRSVPFVLTDPSRTRWNITLQFQEDGLVRWSGPEAANRDG
jgi:hypothetical protein